MSKFYENRLVINRLWHDYFYIKPHIIPRKRYQPSAFGLKLIPLSLEWYGAWHESKHVIVSLYLQIWTGSVVLPIVMCPKEADRTAPSVHPDVCPDLSVAIFMIIMVSCLYLIHLMTKPAKTQISLGIHPVWSVFAVRMKKAWVLSYPQNGQRIWSDWAHSQAGLSLHWAHSHFVGFDMR